tara:strand:- start:5616 stop:6464 length:849 start_codon:yes stop_codon:yes gene_type:complete
MKFADYKDKVNSEILSLMNNHGSDWIKPWSTNLLASGEPHNAFSKRKYSGLNYWYLSSMGFEVPAFATFKQWKDKGATIRKGEKGTPAYFLGTGKDKSNDDTYKFMKVYYLFNVAQVEGFDQSSLEDYVAINKVESKDKAESLISTLDVDVQHSEENRAYFSPHLDMIGMPHKEYFFSTEDYYSTLLHELTHWTGHTKRLSRSKGSVFGDDAYAQEELIAEVGSAQLCNACEITKTTRSDHVKYINAWQSAIKTHDDFIVKAFSQAGKSTDYLLERYKNVST